MVAGCERRASGEDPDPGAAVSNDFSCCNDFESNNDFDGGGEQFSSTRTGVDRGRGREFTVVGEQLQNRRVAAFPNDSEAAEESREVAAELSVQVEQQVTIEEEYQRGDIAAGAARDAFKVAPRHR